MPNNQICAKSLSDTENIDTPSSPICNTIFTSDNLSKHGILTSQGPNILGNNYAILIKVKDQNIEGLVLETGNNVISEEKSL